MNCDIIAMLYCVIIYCVASPAGCLCKVNMPISMEQWRASVGSNNAHLVRRYIKKQFANSPLGHFMSLLMALLIPGVGLQGI